MYTNLYVDVLIAYVAEIWYQVVINNLQQLNCKTLYLYNAICCTTIYAGTDLIGHHHLMLVNKYHFKANHNSLCTISIIFFDFKSLYISIKFLICF